MKVLIAYASKTGATSKAAKFLAERFSNVTLRDLTVGSPNPKDYEAVILGGSIRIGTLHKDARKWLEEYGEVLKTKKFGCFICHGFPEQAPQLLEQNIPQELLDVAVCVDSFGGELDEKKLRGMDRLIMNMMLKSVKGKLDFVPCIRTDRIEVFADAFLRLEEQ